LRLGGVESINIPKEKQTLRDNSSPVRSDNHSLQENKNKINEFLQTDQDKQTYEIGSHQVINAIEMANKSYVSKYTRLEFGVHEQTKHITVKVYDKETDELIREIPPEKILDMVAKMWELAGILVDDKV